MTERLYYTDSYLSYVKARVVDADPAANILYLDRTPFYPTSGGQPHDLGTISGQPVLEVIDEGQRIAHRTAVPVSENMVECQIEWARRYDHMQQHTGQHVLSAVWMELFSIPTKSFHIGAENSTVELGARDLTDEQIERAEQRANQVAREGRLVSVSFDDSQMVTGLRKPSGRDGLLRIVTIDGLDRSACGGTHVGSTAEVVPIQIRRTEKIRGNVRLEFVCGARAERRARQDYRIVAELARLTAVGLDDLPEAVNKLRVRLTEVEKDKVRLSHEVGRLEATILSTETRPSEDGIRRVALNVLTIDDAARVKAQTFVSHTKSVLLMTSTSQSGVLVACSADSGLNAGAILRDALAQTGGRGGGTATLAQGNVSDPTLTALLEEALGFSS
ncbi:MAG: alanyl-tRNA synthetase [Bryobacterales bacterium]|nr:alanyl-tRNA synthetase [Bryobacterales bacterium]